MVDGKIELEKWVSLLETTGNWTTTSRKGVRMDASPKPGIVRCIAARIDERKQEGRG